MILNDLQYRVTKNESQKFANAIEGLKRKPLGKIDPLLRKAQLDAMKSHLEELNQELVAYDDLKRNTTAFFVHSLENLPLGLIQTRIKQGLTQEQLAKKLGVPKQQVQRDEEMLYESADLKKLAKVAEVLNVKFEVKVRRMTKLKLFEAQKLVKMTKSSVTDSSRVNRSKVRSIKKRNKNSNHPAR